MLKGRLAYHGNIVPITVDEGRWVDASGAEVPPDEARILPPAIPSKIVCVGRNYARHAEELGNPVPERPLLFLKPPSAVTTHESPIRLPPDSRRVEYEGEIAVVIGKTCRRLSDEENPMAAVAGFTALNDITARDLQRLDVQFTRGKSFDTFCPFGPWIEEDADWRDLTVETHLNGELKQRGSAKDMIFPIPDLIRYIARIMTLYPGDLIATGTPEGVGPVKEGDRVAVTVSGVTLANPVEGE